MNCCGCRTETMKKVTEMKLGDGVARRSEHGRRKGGVANSADPPEGGFEVTLLPSL